MEKGNSAKALSLFKKVLEEENRNVAAYYGLATLFGSTRYGSLNLNRAYNNISAAKKYFKRLKKSDKAVLKSNNITEQKILSLENKISRYFFAAAKKENTLRAYNDFIKKFPNSKVIENVLQLKRELEFEQAKSADDIKNLNEFIRENSEGEEVAEAILLRNKKAFDHALKENTIEAFDEFIDLYPSSNEIKQAIELRNQLSYITHLEEKKAMQDSIVAGQEKELQQQNKLNSMYILGLALTLILIFIIVFAYFQKRKASKEILAQKLTIEHKNNEMLDSINYAKYIQDAILPPSKVFEKYLPNSFVLYKPKDIVSGDFYWLREKNDLVYFSVVDCTGHGVPGALMSIIGNNALNRAILEKGLDNPADILNQVNKTVFDTLHQTGEANNVKDGMDMALCVWNKKTNTLQYAGANNSLYYIRDGQLSEIKADKHPIGSYKDETVKFKNHTIKVQKVDMIYLFSDGFADQFGGPKGKKFMYKQFKTLLTKTADMPSMKQGDFLLNHLKEWQGDIEQLDDVCIIGVRI